MNLPPRTKLQPDGWAMNPQKSQLVGAFRAPTQRMPNNPNNLDQPIPSPHPYDAASQGLVAMVNPYGDGSLQVMPQGALLTRPADPAALMAGMPPAPNATEYATPGYGFLPEQSALTRIDGAQQQTPVMPQQPMGMSTGVAIGGPQRNVPKPA
jgi:hypothetical protein